MSTVDKSDVVKVLCNLTLVKNISEDSYIKVKDKDIKFAKPVDEFAEVLIEEIPELYKTLKVLVTNPGSIEENLPAAKIYIELLENKLIPYLQESRIASLLEKEPDNDSGI